MSTPLHSRADLGMRGAKSRTTIRASHLTAHYGGPSPWAGGAASADHNRCASIWRGYQAFHMDARGWSDIAYSSGVCPHGHRFEGRGPGVRTAAQGTNPGNSSSLATCYIAGDGDPLTDAAMEAFRDEADRFGVPLDRTHDQWHSTSCPGSPLRAWVRGGAPRPGVSVPPSGPPVVPPAPRPPQPATGAPPFPLPRGWYFGPRSGPRESVSGYHGNREHLRAWQARMAARGWRIGVDGLYGSGTADVARRFQRQKGLAVDGLIGPATWAAAWTAPVT